MVSVTLITKIEINPSEELELKIFPCQLKANGSLALTMAPVKGQRSACPQIS